MLKDMWRFKDTAAGKFLAVAMSIILVIGMTNTNALAFAEDADGAEGQSETMEVSDVIDLTKVTFEIGEGASVKAASETVKDGDAIEATSHEAFGFNVSADEGYEIESVAVDGEELAAEGDGAYEIAADDMNGDVLKVQVKTAAAPADEPAESEEPTQPEQPAAPAEEEATQETPAPEEEITYPAFEGYGKINGTTVKVTAEKGVLPAGTSLKISEAQNENKVVDAVENAIGDETTLDNYVAFNVSFFDEDWNEIQPNGPISVSVVNSELEGDEVAAFYVEDKSLVAEEVTLASTADDIQKFEAENTDGVYLIGQLVPVVVVEKAQKLVTIEVVYSNGDMAAAPETIALLNEGDKDNQKYTLDYKLAQNSNFVASIDGEELVAENGQYTIAREYSDAADVTITVVLSGTKASYTVKYVNADNPSEKLLDSITVEDGIAGAVTTVEALEIPGYTAQEVQQEEIKGDGSTVVTVLYDANAYKLNYNTMGGSYIKAKDGKYNETVEVYGLTGDIVEGVLICESAHHDERPSGTPDWRDYYSGTTSSPNGCYKVEESWGYYRWVNTCQEQHPHNDSCYTTQDNREFDPAPTREGYEFGGWYADEACTQEAPQQVTFTTDDITVYAKWIPKTVTYTQAIYKEVVVNDPNGGEPSFYYAYVTSQTKSAKVGETVSAAFYTSNFENSSYYTQGERETATVKADGSTVVAAKYNLKRYTFTFDLGSSNAYVVMDGQRHYGTYEISGIVLGLDISAKWPTSDKLVAASSGSSLNVWTSSGLTNQKTKIVEVDSSILPSGSTRRWTASWTTSTSIWAVQYWLQQGDGTYKADQRYSQEFINSSGLTQKEIFGYSKRSGRPSYSYPGSDYNQEATIDGVTKTYSYVYNFYYTANTNSITYKYKDNIVTTKTNIRFGSDISGDEYNKSIVPVEGVPAGYTFAGWYEDSNFMGDPYPFTTMPNNSVVLYAKFVAPTRYVTVNYDNGTDNGVIEIEQGKVLSEIPVPTKPGYDFAGWFTEDGEEFDVNAPIENNVTIVAHWSAATNITYNVKHVVLHDGKYAEIVPTESITKRAGSTVQAKALTSTELSELDYEGYFTTTPTQTLKLVVDESNPGKQFEMVFVYANPANLTYQVFYTFNGERLFQDFVEDGKVDVSSGMVPVRATSFVHWPSDQVKDWAMHEGYNFPENYQGTKVNVDSTKSNTVVEIELVLQPYGIQYELNGGAFAEGVEAPTKYNVNDKDIQVPNPTKPGYVFTGWTPGENTSGPGLVINNEGQESTLTINTSIGHIQLVANWKAAAAKIVFEEMGGSDVADMEGVTDQKIDDRAMPSTTKVGYIFKGWLDESGVVATELPVAFPAGTTTYTASWELVPEPTIEWGNAVDADGWVYDGQAAGSAAHPISVNLNDESLFGKVKYTFLQNVAEEGKEAIWAELPEGLAPVNVGNYKVRADWAGTEICAPLTAEAEFSISPAPIRVQAKNATKKYDTADPELAYDVIVGAQGSEREAFSGALTRAEGEAVNTDPGYAIAQGTLALADNGDFKASNYVLEFVPATFTITDNDTMALTANGYEGAYDAGTHFAAASANIEGAVVEWRPAGAGDDAWTTTAPSIKDVDEASYEVRATAEGYVTQTATVTLKVTEREIVLESDSFSKVYDGKPLTNKGEDGTERPLKNAGDFAKGEGVELTFTSSITNVAESGAPNSFTIEALPGTDLDNYNIKVVEGTLTVKPLDITNDPTDPTTAVLAVEGPDNVIYNGQPQKLKPVSVKFGDTELVYEDWMSSAEASENGYWIQHANANVVAKDDFTNAGSTIEILIFPNSSNFTGHATVTYQINKRPATIYAGAASMTYNAPTTLQYQPATAEAFDSDKHRGFVTADIPAAIQQTLKSEVEAYDEAKRYENEVTVIGRNDLEAALTNYVLSYEDSYLDINNANDNVVTVNNIAGAAGMTKVYNGVATSIVANARVEGSTFEYSLDGVNWSGTNPTFTNVGTYTVWVRANAANYETTRPVSARVTITPASVTITVNGATKMAGTADPAFTGTVTGLVNAGDLGAISFYRTNTAQAAGVYPNVLTASYLANPNYTVTVVPATFTITAAPVVLGPGTPTPPTPPAGGGAPAPVVTPAPVAATPAPEAPAAVAIDDDPTPMTNLPEAGTQRAEATIEDDEVPQTAFDNEDPDCWVHFLMILGILLTIAYAGCVVARRTNFTRGLKSREEDFAGETTEETVTVPAGMTAAVRK